MATDPHTIRMRVKAKDVLADDCVKYLPGRCLTTLEIGSIDTFIFNK